MAVSAVAAGGAGQGGSLPIVLIMACRADVLPFVVLVFVAVDAYKEAIAVICVISYNTLAIHIPMVSTL